MRDALLAALISQIVVFGTIIIAADSMVNKRTMYAAIFGVAP